MLTFYLLCGPPGSGKSYTAKEYERQDVTVVSRDAVLAGLQANKQDTSEDNIWLEVLQKANTALRQGRHTLIDATFSKPERRKAAVRMARELNGRVHIVALVMYTSLADCKRQNLLREGEAKIPTHDVERRYYDFWRQPPQSNIDGIDEVRYLRQ